MAETVRVSRAFTFDAALRLPDHEGVCRNLHGHTYHLTVTVENEIQPDGMALDFLVLERIVKERIVDRFDHTYLNDAFEVPSAENLAVWMWRDLEPHLPGRLFEIRLGETPYTWVTYRGPREGGGPAGGGIA